MDSGGNFYANEAAKKALEEILGKPGKIDLQDRLKPADIRALEEKPSDAIDVDADVAEELVMMNRRQRMVFYSERAHGKDCYTALEAAKASLPER